MRTSSMRQLAVLGMVVVYLVLPVRAQRAIPDDNLAYPVLIQLPDQIASGFYLNAGSSTYLVTAKHVLFDQQTGRLRNGPVTLISYSSNPKESGANVLQLDLAALSQAGRIKGHAAADVAVIQIAEIIADSSTNAPALKQVRVVSGVTVHTSVATGILGVDVNVALKKYDDVLVANEVLLFGYPTSLGMRESPQLDPQRPLLRRGIVAGLNSTARSIIIDCPSYPGNSGGPVVETDHIGFQTTYKVIGVVSEFVPFAERSINYPIQYQSVTISNSGYTIVTPMDFVLELVK
jgi:trypsin-like peptidase